MPESVLDRAVALGKIAGSDRNALKCLYHDIAPNLFAVLIRMVRHRELAEDLLQDTFVAIWTKAHQFDAERGSADAWLFSIARRKAIDRLRISWRETTGDLDDVAGWDHFSGLQFGCVDMETVIAVKSCMASLPSDIGKAVRLCYLYGLTHEELAAEMAVPLGTAKSWVRRGLAELKAAMTFSLHPTVISLDQARSSRKA